MRLWADTFGGGNSFTQSVSNVATPGDGQSYVGGQLVNDDSYSGPNLDGSAGYDIDWGGNGSSDNVNKDGTLNNTNDVTVTTSGGTVDGPGGSGSTTDTSQWKTATIGGAEVRYTGTPGAGDFFVEDTSFIDPYQYLELIGGDYDKEGNWSFDNADGSTVFSDNAAFDMSHYVKDEDHAADVEFYNKNPNSTITTEQFGKAMKISKGLSLMAGPLGLGSRAIVELQRRGLLPGNTATSWFERNNIPDTTGNSNEDKILQLAAEGASNEEIEDAINEALAAEEIQGIASAVGAMSDAAFGSSSVLDVINNPENYMAEGTNLSDNIPTIDPNAAGTNIDGSQYTPGENPEVQVETVQDVATVDDIQQGEVQGYDVETVDDKLNDPAYQAEGVQGTLSSGSIVNAEQINIEDTANGINAVGKALNDFAKVDISRVIDTSTVQGKLLADKLGQGNYVDSKSTIMGQMQVISEEFKDANGDPKIPAWGQALARNVQRTISFGGMSGTAATAALANAMMEASLGVAEKEAAFFQTLTVKNLDNRQESIIQKASVLANMELANLDARQEAAVQNAKSFLSMDLANLDNKQQADILNTQIRVDGLLEDAKAVNAERLFRADAQNEFTKFYDNLSAEIAIHRANTLNEMARFNAGEINDNREFQASLDQRRDEFYKNMQYNIDLANAKWRQEITLQEAAMAFDAAKFDAENLFNLTSEALSRVWDREDANFDYIWKSSESEKERLVDLYEIDKEYEVDMRKLVNDENYKKGQADWELFKWGMDALEDFDLDFWDWG